MASSRFWGFGFLIDFMASSRPPFGGLRWWFVCPHLNRRVRKLYLPLGGRHFWSRRAYELASPRMPASEGNRMSQVMRSSIWLPFKSLVGLRPTMLTSATRAGGLSDDKWQAPEVIILTFDSRRNLAACLGAPNHDHVHALLPSSLIQREAMRQTSDATDATRISSRLPMCLTPAVVIRSGQTLRIHREGASTALPSAERPLLETWVRAGRACDRNRHARHCAPGRGHSGCKRSWQSIY
jgi:hypothetical protein